MVKPTLKNRMCECEHDENLHLIDGTCTECDCDTFKEKKKEYDTIDDIITTVLEHTQTHVPGSSLGGQIDVEVDIDNSDELRKEVKSLIKKVLPEELR